VPALAVNTALELPPGTVTLDGTVTMAALELNATILFPAATLLNVTVQELEPPDSRALGLHTSDDTATGATRFSVAPAELLL